MPRNDATSSGIATITSHAPSANFVQMTTRSATPVAVAPTALTASLCRQPGSRLRSQYRTIPDCDSVKAVNTPITYRWISESTLALYAQRSATATPVSTMIPFEKTSRSPRLVNWRAKKRSRASSAARRGNPWYEVFAASTSTASVSACTAQYMKPRADDDGKTARAISDSTEGVPVAVGRACMCTASHETPTNIVIAIDPRISIVFAAFLPCGRLNALTPFAIASTPVRAVEPDEKARRTTNAVTAPTPLVSGCGAAACGHVPSAQRATP